MRPRQLQGPPAAFAFGPAEKLLLPRPRRGPGSGGCAVDIEDAGARRKALASPRRRRQPESRRGAARLASAAPTPNPPGADPERAPKGMVAGLDVLPAAGARWWD
jgi:hypothetical protein